MKNIYWIIIGVVVLGGLLVVFLMIKADKDTSKDRGTATVAPKVNDEKGISPEDTFVLVDGRKLWTKPDGTQYMTV